MRLNPGFAIKRWPNCISGRFAAHCKTVGYKFKPLTSFKAVLTLSYIADIKAMSWLTVMVRPKSDAQQSRKKTLEGTFEIECNMTHSSPLLPTNLKSTKI